VKRGKKGKGGMIWKGGEGGMGGNEGKRRKEPEKNMTVLIDTGFNGKDMQHVTCHFNDKQGPSQLPPPALLDPQISSLHATNDLLLHESWPALSPLLGESPGRILGTGLHRDKYFQSASIRSRGNLMGVLSRERILLPVKDSSPRR
jgi:hypothetical protein